MRAFVALDLPEEALAPISRLQAGLTVGRAVPEENLHLTLAFLGEIREPQAEAVAEALDGLALPPVTLTLSGLDLFGGDRPTVLFIAAEGEALQRLHDKVARAVREAGVALPRERFRPHVTVARLPKEMTGRDHRRLGEFLALNGRFSLPPQIAPSVTLYRSHLGHEGAYHEPLATFFLAPGEAA